VKWRAGRTVGSRTGPTEARRPWEGEDTSLKPRAVAQHFPVKNTLLYKTESGKR